MAAAVPSLLPSSTTSTSHSMPSSVSSSVRRSSSSTGGAPRSSLYAGMTTVMPVVSWTNPVLVDDDAGTREVLETNSGMFIPTDTREREGIVCFHTPRGVSGCSVFTTARPASRRWTSP
jgi:hypothetical protein